MPRVNVVGEVDSIAQSAAGSFAAVCPVRMGAGVQNKLLDYLAMGIPAVSTSVGMEGLDIEHERHVLRADEPGDMAAALMRLWADEALAWQLARNGRAHVERYHAWDRVLSPLISSMMEAVERRSS
jgi:glycosyltransferase involved in cell wall biosynthesis